VPLPDLPAVARRVRRNARPNAAEPADGAPTRDELAALVELEGPAAVDPGERAEQARRTASRYLRERRRRLRRELGALEAEHDAST
jgi:hypothetical protein